MRETVAVYRKEMRSYLVSPIPYILVAIFAAAIAIFVFAMFQFLLLRQSNLEAMFQMLPWAMMILVPAVAMRLWSEEIRQGTYEALLTMPARTRHLVLGKFLAGLTVLAACLLATAGLPITAATLGDLDMGPVWAGYLGALLMGGAFLAIGLWLSCLTRNQIVAFLLGLAACFALVLVGSLSAQMPHGGMADFVEQLAVGTHFRSIGRGVIDIRDIAYFASFIAFFLYLNVEAVENRRYR